MDYSFQARVLRLSMGIATPPLPRALEPPFLEAASGDSLEIHQASLGLMGSGAWWTDRRSARIAIADELRGSSSPR